MRAVFDAAFEPVVPTNSDAFLVAGVAFRGLLDLTVRGLWCAARRSTTLLGFTVAFSSSVGDAVVDGIGLLVVVVFGVVGNDFVV